MLKYFACIPLVFVLVFYVLFSEALPLEDPADEDSDGEASRRLVKRWYNPYDARFHAPWRHDHWAYDGWNDDCLARW